jgi:hypothetical protein
MILVTPIGKIDAIKIPTSASVCEICGKPSDTGSVVSIRNVGNTGVPEVGWTA